jgi:Tol biopolymer transport system component
MIWVLTVSLVLGCSGGAGPAAPESPDAAPQGFVAVGIVTAGEEIPSTLEVFLGESRRAIAHNSQVVFSSTRSGSQTVRIAGVATLCELVGSAERQVTVVLRDTARVNYQIQCPVAGSDRLIVAIGANLFSMTEYATRARQLTSAVQNYFASISPDGSRIAFTTNRDGNEEIYIMKADGSDQRNLTSSSSTRDSWPKWSPDGTKIIFYSWAISAGPAAAEIYVVSASGGPWTRLTSNGALDADPEFSPDGRRIVFMSERDGNQEIYVMNADGTAPIRLTNDPGRDGTPTWSPDGNRIAFATTRFAAAGTDAYEIAVMNADGSGFVRLTNHPEIDVNPVWSPGGQRIVYNHRLGPGDYDIRIINADGSGDRALLQGNGNQQAYAWRVLQQ